MRKSLLIITLALMSSLTMMADYTFKFCGGFYTAFSPAMNYDEQLRVSIDVPADMATELAGNQITSIRYGMYAEAKAEVGVTVFVMENGEYVSTGFDEDPLAGQTEGVTLQGALDTPYTIKENTPFTFGYVLENGASGLYPVALSQSGPAMFSGRVELLQDEQVVGIIPNIAEATGGYTTFLAAVSEGQKDGLFNYVVLEAPGSSLSTVEAGQSVTTSFKLYNVSSKSISSIKFNIEVGGETTEYEYTRRIGAGASKSLSFDTPAIPEGRNSIIVKVAQTNGENPVNNATSSSPVIGLAPGQGFPQMVVVEEGTGTWCGWCPRGIVGMEYMAETYPDDFIGICVHGGDTFSTSSYDGLDKFITGYPSSVTNRQSTYISDPDKSNLETIYDQVVAHPSAAQIALEVVNGENELYAVSTTNFAFDHFCEQGYKVAFVIIENGLVGAQTNYYSGQAGTLEWWDTQRGTVVWTYTDTARDIFDFNGLDASLINNQVSTEPYVFQTTLPLTNVKDVTQTAVIALLLDDETGVIMNACRVYYDNYRSAEETGVSNVALDQDAQTVGYYTISGQKVENPQRGQLYIETLSNGKAVKRIFK